jgi:outer membrane protein
LPPSPDAAVSHALSSFPEILQATYTVEDSEIALKLARASGMPRVFASFNLGTGYSGASRIADGLPPTTEELLIGTLQVNDSLAYDLTTQRDVYNFITTPFNDQLNTNFNQSLFFSMSIPIFNNFSVKSAREQAQVNVLRSEYQLEQTRQVLTASIESACAADRAFLNSEKRFEAGATTAVDYADARTLLDNARVNALRAKYDLAFKSRILEFYMGRAITFR